jgi:hypothetical protein
MLCFQDKLRAIENDLVKCQRDMAETDWISPASFDDVTLQEKEKMADALVAQCKAGQNQLTELSCSVEEKHKTDPNIFAPAELSGLQQHWRELLEKVLCTNF